MSAATTGPIGFPDQVKQHYQGFVVTMMIDLGHRLGLWAALAGQPATADQLAERAGSPVRHTTEWLGAVTVAGIVDHQDGVYTLPQDRAFWLTGAAYTNLAPMSGMFTGLAERLSDVEGAFRTGSGVPYERYRPHFTHAMDAVGRARYDALLVSAYLPKSPGLVERLTAGVDAVDLGCGTGHCINLMAAAFPASRFRGIDLSAEAIALAEAESRTLGLTNTSFEAADLLDVPTGPCADVVFAFDAIHDQRDPRRVLSLIESMVRPGGELFMVDIRASSDLDSNAEDPSTALLYGISVMHCMEVGLVDGGAGLGTVWGTELATRLLNEAGFSDVSVHAVKGDPTNQVYTCRR